MVLVAEGCEDDCSQCKYYGQMGWIGVMFFSDWLRRVMMGWII